MYKDARHEQVPGTAMPNSTLLRSGKAESNAISSCLRNPDDTKNANSKVAGTEQLFSIYSFFPCFQCQKETFASYDMARIVAFFR